MRVATVLVLAVLVAGAAASSAVACDTCQHAVHGAKLVLEQDGTLDRVKEVMTDLCAQMGDLKSQCLLAVRVFSAAAVTTTRTHGPHAMCQWLESCTAEDPAVVFPVPNQPMTCSSCNHAVTQTQTVLADPAIRARIIAGAKELCMSIEDKSVSKACDATVHALTSSALDMVLSLPAEPVCWMLGHCVDVEGDAPAVLADAADSYLADPNMWGMFAALEGNSCSMCMEYLGEVQKFSHDETDIRIIRRKLVGLCHFLGPADKPCEALFGLLFDAWMAVLQTSDTHDLCKLLKACDTFSPATEATMLFGAEEAEQLQDSACQMCHEGIAEVAIVGKDSARSAKLVANIGKLCQYTGPGEKACTPLFTNLFAGFLKAAGTLEPRTICKLMHVCDSEMDAATNPVMRLIGLLTGQVDIEEITGGAAPPAKIVEPEPAVSGAQCSLCKATVKKAKEIVTEEPSHTKARELVVGACQHVKQQQDACAFIAGSVFDIAVDTLNDMSDEEVCTYAKQCDGTEEYDDGMVLTYYHSFDSADNDVSCALCTSVLKQLLLLVDDPVVVEKTKHGLQSLCKKLFKDEVKEEQCESTVSILVDVGVGYLIDADPHTICELVKLCQD